MVVIIHNKGDLSTNGAADYLLGEDRKRKDALLLRGDPEAQIQLMNTLNFSKYYTSATLSFSEEDLPEPDKNAIMD